MIKFQNILNQNFMTKDQHFKENSSSIFSKKLQLLNIYKKLFLRKIVVELSGKILFKFKEEIKF